MQTGEKGPAGVDPWTRMSVQALEAWCPGADAQELEEGAFTTIRLSDRHGVPIEDGFEVYLVRAPGRAGKDALQSCWRIYDARPGLILAGAQELLEFQNRPDAHLTLMRFGKVVALTAVVWIPWDGIDSETICNALDSQRDVVVDAFELCELMEERSTAG